MTTKKIVITVVTLLVSLALLIVLFAGGIILFAFYQINHSDAALAAKQFLRNNQRLKEDIGEVKDFGTFTTGSITVHNNNGTATLGLKVIGQNQTANATVDLLYTSGRPWRATAASYKNGAGETVDLLNAYESLKPLLRLAA